jgi:hypothetical protein
LDLYNQPVEVEIWRITRDIKKFKRLQMAELTLPKQLSTSKLHRGSIDIDAETYSRNSPLRSGGGGVSAKRELQRIRRESVRVGNSPSTITDKVGKGLNHNAMEDKLDAVFRIRSPPHPHHFDDTEHKHIRSLSPDGSRKPSPTRDLETSRLSPQPHNFEALERSLQKSRSSSPTKEYEEVEKITRSITKIPRRLSTSLTKKPGKATTVPKPPDMKKLPNDKTITSKHHTTKSKQKQDKRNGSPQSSMNKKTSPTDSNVYIALIENQHSKEESNINDNTGESDKKLTLKRSPSFSWVDSTNSDRKTRTSSKHTKKKNKGVQRIKFGNKLFSARAADDHTKVGRITLDTRGLFLGDLTSCER